MKTIKEDTMLKINNLQVNINDKTILKDLNLNIKRRNSCPYGDEWHRKINFG